jgi:hypothetical protein
LIHIFEEDRIKNYKRGTGFDFSTSLYIRKKNSPQTWRIIPPKTWRNRYEKEK